MEQIVRVGLVLVIVLPVWALLHTLYLRVLQADRLIYSWAESRGYTIISKKAHDTRYAPNPFDFSYDRHTDFVFSIVVQSRDGRKRRGLAHCRTRLRGQGEIKVMWELSSLYGD